MNSALFGKQAVYKFLKTMSSPSVFHKQAEEAELLITKLKQQILFLRTSCGEGNVKDLKEENQRLLNEVNSLKTALTLAEIKNGVRQVYVPANIATVVSPSKTVAKPLAESTIGDVVKGSEKVNSPKQDAVKGNKSAAPSSVTSKPKAKPAKAVPQEDKMDVSRLDFRVGRITDVKYHEKADTLYVEQVDVGEDMPRTVVSGLVNHVPIEEMKDKVAVFMCNLKPVKVRDILSQAMIMCVTREGHTEILVPPPGSQIGDRVHVAEYPGCPDAQLNPKKKIWEQLKPDMLTNNELEATYKGAKWIIDGKGTVLAQSIKNGQIS